MLSDFEELFPFIFHQGLSSGPHREQSSKLRSSFLFAIWVYRYLFIFSNYIYWIDSVQIKLCQCASDTILFAIDKTLIDETFA